MEIVLSSGKKIAVREKTGQFHLIEGRLLTSCAPGTGANVIGAQLVSTDISTVCSIAAINGKEVKIPESLADMYDIMSGFEYDEYSELKLALRKSEAEKIEAMAKKLQSNPGSVQE